MNNDNLVSIDFSNEIINVALNLSMEFGENWLLPVNQRLSKKYPNLTVQELDDYNDICKSVNKIGNNHVYNNPIYTSEKTILIDFEQFKNYMLGQFDWITNGNLSKLYSQSCYYAMK